MAPWTIVAAAFLSGALGEYLASLLSSLPLWRIRPDLHWSERARRSWSMRVILGSGPAGLLGTSVVVFGALNQSDDFDWRNPAFRELYPAIPLALYAGAICGSIPLLRRVTGRRASWASVWGDYAVAYLIRTPTSLIFLVMFALLVPRTLDAGSVTIMAASFTLSVALTLDLAVRLARAVHLLTPAPARLEGIVREICERKGFQMPRAYLLHWRWANAVSFSFAPAIAFTPPCLEILSDEEVAGICAHELAHRQETRTQKLIRFSGLAVAFPIFAIPVWARYFGLPGVIGPAVIYVVGVRLLRRFGRRMEVRADEAARESSAEAATFAAALEKCYRFNMVPAVMRGRNQVHPHLYDRLVAAGIAPDYPRPRPPSVAVAFASFLVLNLVAILPIFLWR